MGFGGGQEGWYRKMAAAGPEALFRYGQAVGRRYGHLENIMWVHCGDFDPPDRRLALAVANGIREQDRRALHTVHGGPETDVLDYWKDEPWLSCGNIYTYGPVAPQAAMRFRRPDRKPFFLIESAYENEHNAGEQRLRAQAYQALLSGACGQFFGNNPVWAFGAKMWANPPVAWRAALGSRGAQSMTHVHTLLSRLPWWRLTPDLDGQFMQGGISERLRNGPVQVLLKRFGQSHGRAVAAFDADRSFALAYLPDSRAVQVDLGIFQGRDVIARWYDPAGGDFRPAEFARAGDQEPVSLRPPAKNAAGLEDWVLLVEAG
jgi:hypothetical protein